MGIYILKTAACWAILYLFYKFLLERESMHSVKRWYLLGGLVAGALIPLVEFTTYVAYNPNAVAYIVQTSSEGVVEQGFWASIDWPQLLWTVYWIGVIIFALRFLWNLGKLIRRIVMHPRSNQRTLFFVLLGRPVQPHTFFRYIFVNKKRFKAAEIPQEVLLHEKAHAQQLHSADVIAVELIQVFFWFNPLVYLIKHSMLLNHEFLADRAVLSTGISKRDYQNTLLAYLNPKTSPELASAINYSSIKKRFTLMKNSSSKQTQWAKSLLLLPLLAILLYSFSSTREVLVEEEVPLADLTEYVEVATENGEYLPVKHPTYQDFERWQNTAQYGLWIDGHRVPNSEIMEYHPDDLPYFAESNLEPNAKNYGDYYVQVEVMSNSYWQDQIGVGFVTPEQQKQIIDEALEEAQDRKSLNIDIEGTSVTVNGTNATLRDFRRTVDKATRNWEEQDYKEAYMELRISNPNKDFMNKLNDEFKKTNYFKANPSEYGLNPPPPPPPPPAPTVKKVENVIIEEIESELPPPPPPPTKPGEVIIEEIETELPPPPPPPKSVDVIIEEVVDENGVTKRVVKRKNVIEEVEVEEVEEIEEIEEIIEIKEGDEGQVVRVETIVADTPPPPPPPKTTLEMMREMKQKGAEFFLNGNSISADKAIELAKNEDALKTIDISGRDGKYKVYLAN